VGDRAFDGHQSLAEVFIDTWNTGWLRHGRGYEVALRVVLSG
jgi:hypothetical protein